MAQLVKQLTLGLAQVIRDGAPRQVPQSAESLLGTFSHSACVLPPACTHSLQ